MIAEAASIMKEPTRNAWVAPWVNVARKPRLASCEGSPPCLGEPGGQVRADLRGTVVDEVQRDRGEHRQAECATDLLHGVEHTGTGTAVLGADAWTAVSVSVTKVSPMPGTS